MRSGTDRVTRRLITAPCAACIVSLLDQIPYELIRKPALRRSAGLCRRLRPERVCGQEVPARRTGAGRL